MTTQNDSQVTELLQKVGTTVIVDGPTIVKSATAPRVEDPAQTATTGLHQDIADFLAKPCLVATFAFDNTKLINDVLYYNDIAVMLKNNPVWMNKLSGTGSIRATAVIELQVNASPFNAGGLLMHFLPNYADNIPFHTGRTSLVSKSQQPSIRLDINKAHSMAMDVPYVSNTTHYSLTGSSLDWGRFFVTVWSPFTTVATAPSSASVSVWLSFKDVDICNPIVPQGAVKKGQRGAIKPHPTEQEKGPVSKILSAVSTLADSLSVIPMLTPITGPVSWFTNVAAGVATSFGWSKPIEDNFGSRVIQGPHFGVANCNGLDFSQPLGLFADNKVRVMSDLGSDGEDQMSINFLKAVPTYFDTFAYATSGAQALIKVITIAPKTGYSFNAIGTAANKNVNVFRTTPLAMLGCIYRLYRGSICVRFRVYKTQFHAGRMVFAFSQSSTAPTFAQTAYLHRAIIDIQEGNEFCFTIPYTYTSDYISTDQPLGYLYIYSLTDLRCPSTVANFVNISAEIFGGPDLEFQVPNGTDLAPITAQGAGDEDPEVSMLCGGIGNSTPSNLVSSASQYTIGEHSTSLLQLMKRYVRIGFPSLPAAMIPSAGITHINPFAISGAKFASNTYTSGPFAPDYYSLFASFYNFSRGGMRFRVSNTQSSGLWCAFLNSNPTTSTFVYEITDPQTSYSTMFRGTFYQPCADGGFSVQVPGYNKTYARLNRSHYAESDVTKATDVNISLSLLGGTAGAPNSVIFSRAAADDFQLSYFIGIPDLSYATSYIP